MRISPRPKRHPVRHCLLAGVMLMGLCGPIAAQDFQSDALWAGFEAGLDLTSCPVFGETQLTPVDLITTHVVPMLAGGPVDAAALGNSCGGHIAAEPDYRVQLSEATARLLVAFVPDSDDHTTLVINAPDGRWHCSNGSAGGRLGALMQFDDAAAGQYDIWVGSRSAEDWVRGELRIGGRATQR